MKSVCIFAGSSLGVKEAYKDLAISLGQALVKKDFSMVYGGGGVGLMNQIANEVLKLIGNHMNCTLRFLKKGLIKKNITK